MVPYRLHHAPYDSSLCVRLALAEARLAYETVPVDRARQAQSLPGYATLNLVGLRCSPLLSEPTGQRGPGRTPFPRRASQSQQKPVPTEASPNRSQTHPREVSRDAGFDAGSFPTPRAA